MAEISENRFDTLNDKVDALIKLCAEMKRENQALKAIEGSWRDERKQLLDRIHEAISKL